MTYRKSTLPWISLALILYLVLSLTYLSLPGLQYDETNFVNAAIGKEDAPFIAWKASLFGRKIPLMIMSYIGALKSGLYAPIFHYFGQNVITVRLPVVCVGLLTLLVSYALFHRLFDRKVALTGMLLFALDPTFVFANRLDWGPISLMLLLEVSSLYFMWRWMQEDKRIFLILAGFLFGLGLYNKIIFGWYVAAFLISLALIFRKDFIRLFHPRNRICFLAALFAGCLPLIVYNIKVPLASFQRDAVLVHFGNELLRNRCDLFRNTLDGSGTYFLFNLAELAAHPTEFAGSAASGPADSLIASIAGFAWVRRSLLPWALLLSLLFIPAYWICRRPVDKRRLFFMAAQLLIIALLICLTADANGAHHVVTLYPFAFALIAFAFCEFGRWVSRSREVPGTILAAACLAPVLLSQLVVDARYLNSFRVYGGIGFWSDAIYDLAAYARSHPEKYFVLMDWGFSTQLSLLTDRNTRFEEFVCDQQRLLDGCLDPWLHRRDALFVFHAPPFGNAALLDAFKEAANRKRSIPHIIKSFQQKDGRPIYIVFETLDLKREPETGDIYFRREAEDFNSKKGGSLDSKRGASNARALGNFWGMELDNYATYRFTVPRNIPDTRIYLRYAFADPAPQSYSLFLDGQYSSSLSLQSTSGYGDTEEEWQSAEADLGYLPQGTHELTIKPAKRRQIVNLDYFVIRDSGSAPALKGR